MQLISFFILGLAVTFVIANDATTNSTNSTGQMNFTNSNSMINTNETTANDTTTTGFTTNSKNTITHMTTSAGERSTDKGQTAATKVSTIPMTPRNTAPAKTWTTSKPSTAGGDSTGIIILVIIIIVAVVFAAACYFTKKRGRQRYSVDLTSRPDEANIPLSTVEPEQPVDAAPQNGLQTFASAETTAKEPDEAEEVKPEVQEEQKAEADKAVVEPSAESAAPAPDSSEGKAKAGDVESSPPAPVEPTVEEKTDDEGVVSNKTSVESLKETNENNSNNADFSQNRDMKWSNIFWEVPLDCPL